MQGALVQWDGEGKTREITVDAQYLAALSIDPALAPRQALSVQHAVRFAVVFSGTHSRKLCRLFKQIGPGWSVQLDDSGAGVHTSIPKSSLLVNLPSAPAATTQSLPQVACLSF